MAITQALCTSFKAELLDAIHDINTDVLKLALFTDAATLNAATTAYSVTGESSGTGYTAGGLPLAGGTVITDGTTIIADFADLTFPTVTVTARGALIYNSSKANRAVAVLDFGSDRTSTNGDFNVIFPAPTALLGLIRLA